MAGALAALVLVPLAIWGVTSLGGEESAELRVESLTVPGGPPEIVVSLPSNGVNDTQTTGGAPSVGLECLNATGEVEFRVEHVFPFTDTDEGTAPPHVHQRVTPQQLAAVERCRLDGTKPALEGELQAGTPL